MTKQSKPLKLKQIKFCKEYLVDLSVPSAAERSGISVSQARKWFKQQNVQDVIEAEFKKRSKRTEVTADKVLAEYGKMGFANITDVCNITKYGVEMKKVEEMEPDAIPAIQEISENRYGVKIKMHDKKGALDSAARHLGMFNDSLRLTADKPLIVINKQEEGNESS